MKVIQFLTLFLFLIILNVANAQEKFLSCYIVTNEHDTVFGTGNISKDQEYCMFQRYDKEINFKLEPEYTNSFRIIGGQYYKSFKIYDENGHQKWYFLEFLVDGEIDLYSISHSNRYFIKKKNDSIIELKDSGGNTTVIDGKYYMAKDYRHIGYMKALMAEAPEVFPKINKLKNLNQRDLVEISKDYHDAVCDEYSCIIYSKNMPKVTYKLEFIGGVNYHNNYYTPMGGILVHIWRPLTNERLYLKLGILYATRPNYNNYALTDDVSEYSVKFPISLQYVFGKKAFKPTIAYGFPTGIFLVSSIQGGFIYTLSNDFEVSFNASIDGILAILMGNQKEMFNNSLGHTFGMGLIYKFK
jgi:hypothetical protein